MRGSLGNPQDHGVTVANEEIAHAVGARAGREQRKATPEEWMGGIGDLDFRRVVYRWVIDRGIKMFDRLTASIKRPSWKRYTQVHTSLDLSRHGSKRGW
jgi:hypothetical protein